LVAAKAFGIITVLIGGEPQEGVDFVIQALPEIERVVKEIIAAEKKGNTYFPTNKNG